MNARRGATVSVGGGGGRAAIPVTLMFKIPEPTLSSASLALAVHVISKSVVVDGAVKIPSDHMPPFVQLTFGPEVTPTLSSTDKTDVAVSADASVISDGAKETIGASLSVSSVIALNLTMPEDAFPVSSKAVRVSGVSCTNSAVPVRVLSVISNDSGSPAPTTSVIALSSSVKNAFKSIETVSPINASIDWVSSMKAGGMPDTSPLLVNGASD